MKQKNMILKLFQSCLYVSAFTFGGGYVIVTLMKKKFVDEYHWIEEDEMLDLIAIAQSAPGAIAVNGAIVIGYKLKGILGVITAVIATILPPFIMIAIISGFYEVFQSNEYIQLMLEGMQAGVGAVMASLVYDMGKGVVQGKQIFSICIMIIAFIGSYIFNIHVIYTISTCILLGLGHSWISKWRKTK